MNLFHRQPRQYFGIDAERARRLAFGRDDGHAAARAAGADNAAQLHVGQPCLRLAAKQISRRCHRRQRAPSLSLRAALVGRQRTRRAPAARALAADRAAELTKRLLVFTRQQPFQPERLSMNGLLRDLMRMLKRLLPETIQVVVVIASRPIGPRAWSF